MGQYTIPTVVEKNAGVERAYDIYSRLLTERIIFLGTEIDDGVANVIMAQLLHLEFASPDVDINLYINSPGGSLQRDDRDLRHHAVHPPGRGHDLHGPGLLGGRGPARGGHPG